MGQMARPAISIGDALASSPGGSGNLLGLVEIRAGRDNEVFAQEQRRRDMLRWISGLEYGGDIRRRLSVTLRMTANAASSIRDAIAETEATTLVLEWPSVASPRRHGLSDLTRQIAQSMADRKSTRLNSSHEWISYAVFCLKKKKQQPQSFCSSTPSDVLFSLRVDLTHKLTSRISTPRSRLRLRLLQAHHALLSVD